MIHIIALVLALFASLPTVEITLPEPTAIVEEEPEIVVDAYEAELMAKTLWGEYRDYTNYEQCASVCWCICNRVDDDRFPGNVEEAVRQPHQFMGFADDNPVEEHLYAIAWDVLYKWEREKLGEEVDRVLPPDCCWFTGVGGVNVFRSEY